MQNDGVKYSATDAQGAKYHDDVCAVEKGNSTNLADCCWQLKRQNPDSDKKEKREKD
jgi:DNA-binding transcriptional regulator PaaX